MAAERKRREAGDECAMVERGGTHLRCKRDNVSFSAVTQGQMGSSLLSALSQSCFMSAQRELPGSRHLAPH